MKNLVPALFLIALLCAVALAQNTPPAPSSEPGASQQQPATPAGQPASGAAANAATNPSQPKNNPLKIAPGSVIPVELAKTVDAKKAKTGEEVVATVTQDMKTNTGEVLVPKDTKIIGHVTEAQPRNKEQKESQLGIAFDHAVVKGDQMPLPMSIQAVIFPQTNNPASAAGDSGGGSPAAAPSSSMGGGRSGSMGGSSPQGSSSQNASPHGQNYPAGGGSSDTPAQTSARPPITGNTQGVIGMPDVKLETTAQNTTQGSVMTSEKNNVKIEKGTMMLLRVNQ
ncbi:MAG: hypothetical protein WA485_08110 [Candidatus Sulfotelmatobacter sp.]